MARQKYFDARAGFLKNVTGVNTRLEQETHKMRIVLLAEMIWNLQDMDEFDSCIAQMHTPNKIESTYAELEIARLLYAIGNVAFSFRVIRFSRCWPRPATRTKTFLSGCSAA